MKKECIYVFLPSEKASYITYQDKIGMYLSDICEAGNSAWKNHELYILSNDSIKKDDWFVNMDFKDEWKVLKLTGGTLPLEAKNCKKIIATTNFDLLSHHFSSNALICFNTPYSISQEDIEYIISLYNWKGSDKKFTTEQIIRAIEMAREEDYGGGVKYNSQEIIEFFTKKSTPNTIMVWYDDAVAFEGGEVNPNFTKPKLQDGNIIILK